MRSSAALALLWASAACSNRDVETRPFHLQATLPDGSSLVSLVTEASIVRLQGTGHVQAGNRLVLGGAVLLTSTGNTALGDVTFTFDSAYAALIAIPARLEGEALTVDAGLYPAGVGPKKEPLQVTGFRIATGGAGLTYEFLIGEGTVPTAGGLAQVPAPLFFVSLTDDIPSLEIAADLLEYEPAECGLVYLDVLLAKGTGDSSSAVALRRGAVHLVAVGQRPDPWIVLHVLSWHRQGACGGQASVWTQLAAWR